MRDPDLFFIDKMTVKRRQRMAATMANGALPRIVGNRLCMWVPWYLLPLLYFNADSASRVSRLILFRFVFSMIIIVIIAAADVATVNLGIYLRIQHLLTTSKCQIVRSAFYGFTAESPMSQREFSSVSEFMSCSLCCYFTTRSFY